MSPINMITAGDLPELFFSQQSHPDRNEFNKDLISPVLNSYTDKPMGGLWLSRISDGDHTDWERYINQIRSASYSSMTRWRIQLNPAAKVAKIDSIDDLAAIHKVYPWEGDPDADGDEAVKMMIKLSRPLDVLKMQDEGIDAIYLTHAGHVSTRYPFRNDGLGTYSWDMESVLVMNPDIVIGSEVAAMESR